MYQPIVAANKWHRFFSSKIFDRNNFRHGVFDEKIFDQNNFRRKKSVSNNCFVINFKCTLRFHIFPIYISCINKIKVNRPTFSGEIFFRRKNFEILNCLDGWNRGWIQKLHKVPKIKLKKITGLSARGYGQS
jgi:hypothetical protein